MSFNSHIITMRYVLRLCALLILLSLFAVGCAPKGPTLKSVDMLSTPNLLVEADAAWQADEFAAAELYYAALLERPDLVRSELPTIYSRLAESAYRNGHYHQARIALEKWANIDTDALSSPAWERTYLNTMAALGKTERLQNHLKWTLENASLPWEARETAALWYSEYFRDREDFERALDVLDGFYKQAPDLAARRSMERAFLPRVERLDGAALDGLLSSVTATNQFRFPYALVGFEHGVRQSADERTWASVWRTLRDLAANADLADRAPLEIVLADLEERFGLPRIGVAMALPLSGPFAKVGVKVLRGAGLAQWRMAQEGVELDLRVVNTEADGWAERLAALPQYFTVVGGPLRVTAFKEMTDAAPDGTNVLGQRAVFAFLASLGELQEGDDAWRFFTSRHDEVRALVGLAVDRLGIKDLAIFYPEEKFGRTMAETFYNAASPLGGRIKGMQSYPPRDLKQWGKRVGKLLDVPADFSENKDVPLDPPDFGAVFVPDGWNQAQTLLPNFFFYEGDGLVFLGPGLWSRALDGAKDIDEHYYRLAVSPGAWRDDSEGGQRLRNDLLEEGLGQADFWVALGHDFLRFGARLGPVPSTWDSDEINRRIQKAQAMDFSMAPMTWDADGVASQDLYLFSPVRNGKELVNADRMAARIARAQARRLKRVEAYEQRMEEEKARQEQNIF